MKRARSARRCALIVVAAATTVIAQAAALLGGPSAGALPAGRMSGVGSHAVSAPHNPHYLYYGTSPDEFVVPYKAKHPGSPLITLIHGGGWESSEVDWNQGKATALQSAGFAVAVINYDSDSPTQPAFPMEPDEVVAGTKFALQQAAALNADPTMVDFVGGSAGSTLAALAAEQLDATDPGVVRNVVTLSGAMNFTLYDPTTNPLDTAQATALGCAVASCPVATEAAASPADHLTHATCPAHWYLFNGTNEITPLAQAQSMESALQAAGCVNALTVVPGIDHSWQYWNKEFAAILSDLHT